MIRICDSRLVLLLICLTSVGCAVGYEDGLPTNEAPTTKGPVELGEELGLPAPTNDAPLPAYQVSDGSKEDSFDVRGSYEDIFGVTAAPRGNVRPIAEFERHDGVLVDWDAYNTTFMIEMLVAISQAAPLHILTDSVRDSEDLRFELGRYGANTNNLNFFEFQNNAFWTRDYGPIPIATDNGAAFVDQRYFSERLRDDAVPTLMARHFGVDTYRPALSTEGGNFMTDGNGVCAATNWLLQGNPNLRESDVRGIMRDYYGCTSTIIVERLDGEGTGHIDMFAKFISEDTVLVGEYDAREEPVNARILDRNAEAFARNNFRVVRMPMPEADAWRGIYRSHTNSLIINGTVLVPTYAQDRDHEREAIAIYERLMPNYRIVTIDSDDPISIGGAIHCTSMGFLTGDANSTLNNPVQPSPQPTPDTPTPSPTPSPNGNFSYSSTPGSAILDNRTTVDTISVSERLSANTATVNIDIAHTYIGDLRVTLAHEGQSVVLHDSTGGSASNLVESYSVGLGGLDIEGDWVLSVTDQANQDQGTFNSWSIEFE